MEQLILRFPHVTEQIFQQLENKDLAKCREVKKLWQKFIDERNYPWLRIVNIPTILRDGNTYMHLAALCGQLDIFEKIIIKEENKNAKNHRGETPFLVACRKGQLNIALILQKKADELRIDLNAKDNNGWTAFHLACERGHANVAEMFMENLVNLSIDPNAKTNEGQTAFHLACRWGQFYLAKIFMENSATLGINLNAKDIRGHTAFNLACVLDNPRERS